ncbi:Disintegrin and metalloproteinase domain-containing protein 10, partial [Fragariocoptes setiger]
MEHVSSSQTRCNRLNGDLIDPNDRFTQTSFHKTFTSGVRSCNRNPVRHRPQEIKRLIDTNSVTLSQSAVAVVATICIALFITLETHQTLAQTDHIEHSSYHHRTTAKEYNQLTDKITPVTKRRLSRHITHYEPLNYDHQEVHRRAKRDLDSFTHSHPIKIDFKAHGRSFDIRLKPDAESVFSHDVVIENGNGESIRDHIDMDMSSLSGHLHEEADDSLVYGSLRKGIFEGKIHTKSGKSFYVERAEKYLGELAKHDQSLDNSTRAKDIKFHSVIYSSDDVVHDHLDHGGNPSHEHDHNHHHESAPIGTCGHLDHKVKDWLESVANSAVPGSEQTDDTESKHKFQDDIIKRMQDYYGYGIDGYSERQFESTRGIWSVRNNAPKNNNHTRKKRQTFGGAELDFSQVFSPKPRVSHNIPLDHPLKRRACSLYIQTDTYLWNHTRRNNANDRDTREEIASLVAQHIKAVNHIYENSDFGGVRGLKFIVQRLRINDTQACDATRKPTNPFCLPNIDVSNFLNLNSQFNHNDFCLAYIFTYRDFSGGTLGLAWVASTSGASGGICEKYKSYTENIHGRQVQTKRSLNTGIITFVNYNSRVPPKVSELTLAHEIGHNFGSPHDYPADCRPGGPQGNYIMYSSATSGERGNNNKFSPCSIRNISTVLHAIFSVEGKENCFQEDDGPFCGNKIVEEGEECDCGYDAKECTENCCYPREPLNEYDRGQPCKRRRDVQCSPSEGPCCNEECSFVSREKVCRHETECSMSQTCDFSQASCPESMPKANLTECNGGTQVCWNGQCTGSICQKYGLEECFLTAKSGAKPEEMCEVACQSVEQPNTCRRTSDIPAMQHISGLKLRPGSPCNDFQGYCDVFQRCRPVDAEGPLARLKNTLLNQKTLMTIKQWATTYWWACMLMLVAFIMLMAAFIKCCAVHTPTSNPKKRPALRITDTLRRPADKLRRKRHNGAAHAGGIHISQGRGRAPVPGRAYAAGRGRSGPSRSQHQSGQDSRHHGGRGARTYVVAAA